MSMELVVQKVFWASVVSSQNHFTKPVMFLFSLRISAFPGKVGSHFPFTSIILDCPRKNEHGIGCLKGILSMGCGQKKNSAWLMYGKNRAKQYRKNCIMTCKNMQVHRFIRGASFWKAGCFRKHPAFDCVLFFSIPFVWKPSLNTSSQSESDLMRLVRRVFLMTLKNFG